MSTKTKKSSRQRSGRTTDKAGQSGKTGPILSVGANPKAAMIITLGTVTAWGTVSTIRHTPMGWLVACGDTSNSRIYPKETVRVVRSVAGPDKTG